MAHMYLRILLLVFAFTRTINAQLKHLGCFKDKESKRAIRGIVTYPESGVIRACKKTAIKNGYSVFGVAFGGECRTGPDAWRTFFRYRRTKGCTKYRGGDWKMDVFRLPYFAFKYIGCFRDYSKKPAIHGSFVYFSRYKIVQKCRERARSRGYRFFGVRGNKCYTSSNAGRTFYKNGRRRGCINGRGNTWLISVYRRR